MRRRGAHDAEARSGDGRRLARLAIALLALAVAFALGRMSANSSGVPDHAASERAVLERDPTSADAPRPRRADPTQAGAARFAAKALSSLADARLLTDAGLRRTVVARIAEPHYRAELRPLYDRTYRYLGDVLGDASGEDQVVLRMAPVGYRVEAFGDGRATVAVWQVTLLATPQRAPIAAWATSRAELSWSEDGWRVERFGVDSPGPTPSVLAPATGTPAAAFVTGAVGFIPFSR
jgi:hypothetical protein